jgi:purine-binding chemotaxis protein CheW
MTTQEQTLEGAKYLTLQLGDEHYGVEILRVREIIGLLDITRLPQMPTYVRGVVNLRGKIIPVLDLRMRLGMPTVEYNARTCVVVLDLKNESEEGATQIGCIVDTVSEVREVDPDDIDPPSSLGGTRREDYIHGLAKLPESGIVVSLLDIDNLLSIVRHDDEESITTTNAADAA